jgi:hypothetical protein
MKFIQFIVQRNIHSPNITVNYHSFLKVFSGETSCKINPVILRPACRKYLCRIQLFIPLRLLLVPA